MIDENPSNPPTGNDEGSTATSPEGPRDRIVDLEIERELHDSYLTYAMSTIMDRALPDVRDGLKPSQRRIMVAMNGSEPLTWSQASKMREDRR